MSRKDISDRAVVAAAWSFQHRNRYGEMKYGTDILADITGEPLKVCEAAYKRAMSRGLIECGVTLRTAWPTPEGLELLKAE